MAVCVPTILTGGANMFTPTDRSVHTNCKDEQWPDTEAVVMTSWLSFSTHSSAIYFKGFVNPTE